MEYGPNNRMRSLICTIRMHVWTWTIHTYLPLFSGRLYMGMIGKAARELLHTKVRRKPEIADTQTKLAGWLTGQICWVTRHIRRSSPSLRISTLKIVHVSNFTYTCYSNAIPPVARINQLFCQESGHSSSEYEHHQPQVLESSCRPSITTMVSFSCEVLMPSLTGRLGINASHPLMPDTNPTSRLRIAGTF